MKKMDRKRKGEKPVRCYTLEFDIILFNKFDFFPYLSGKKKKKKKTRLPMNAADMQWKFSQDHLAADNYNMMPLGPSPYNPFWSGMQPGMEGYVAPYSGSLPYMGYGLGPYAVPFGVLPQAPFGARGFLKLNDPNEPLINIPTDVVDQLLSLLEEGDNGHGEHFDTPPACPSIILNSSLVINTNNFICGVTNRAGYVGIMVHLEIGMLL
ncbi:hypothetical protein Vadar_005590 [Vaccinium darrowii]|uniref:Uncharacterized protein n=1 Tax=Vaccinium darrowii TaxID=229202 RepID=A0ACB7ZHG7_9ERIC|nr:hypothetical protein Vadar_005590 [Vaccinium darrowii]